MNWLSGEPPKSELGKLSQLIFESAILASTPTLEDLTRKFGKGNREFKLKFPAILIEFIYFFIHLSNRSTFVQLGSENSPEFTQRLVTLTVNTGTETLLKDWSEDLKEIIKKDVFHNYNVAEKNYSMCRDIFLTEDQSPVLIVNGQSVHMVGQLVDSVSHIFGPEINQEQIKDNVLEIVKKNKRKLDTLIPKAFAETKVN